MMPSEAKLCLHVILPWRPTARPQRAELLVVLALIASCLDGWVCSALADALARAALLIGRNAFCLIALLGLLADWLT